MSKKEITAKETIIKMFYYDFPLFCRKQLNVRTKTGKIEPFILNEAQIYVNNEIEKQRREEGRVRVIILKGRQQGMSTLVAARFFHRTIFNEGQKSFVFAHDSVSSNALFDIVKKYYDNPQHNHVFPVASTKNWQSLGFSDINSNYSVGTGGGSGEIGRGLTINNLHFSEAAFVDNAKAILSGLMQAVPDEESEIIIESTANGTDNVFYSLCINAMNNKSNYKLIFIPYFIQKEYSSPIAEGENFILSNERPNDETLSEQEYFDFYSGKGLTIENLNWRRKKIKDLNNDYDRFRTEYPANILEAFEASSETALIRSNAIRKTFTTNLIDNQKEFPIIFGVDPAREGGDKFIITVRQGRNILGVRELPQDNITNNSNRLADIINEWSPKAINIDVGGLGIGIYDKLCDLGYSRILHQVNFGGTPDDPDKFPNKATEMFFRTKEWLESSDVSMVSIQEKYRELLIAELSGRQYSWKNDLIILEKKTDFKKRMGNSPDFADSLILTFATRINPHFNNKTSGKIFRAKTPLNKKRGF